MTKPFLYSLCRALLLLLTVFVASASAKDRDPLRLQPEIDAFEQDRLENGFPTGAILCVGSSTMRKWAYRIRDDLYPLTIIPRGFGGSEFSDVLFHFDKLVAPYQPRAILIYEGDNDVFWHKSPARVCSDFRKFREMVDQLDPSIRIYVVSVKPSVRRWELRDSYQKVNDELRELCANDPQMTYIDVWSFMLDDDGQPRPEIYANDLLHLNNLGYNLWASAIGLTLIPAEAPYEQD